MLKDFDGWNQKKKIIHELKVDILFHSQEIWWCSFGINIGVEIDGKNELFERPVLIFRKFNKEMFLGIPLTLKVASARPYYFNFNLNGRNQVAILSQLRNLSSKRLIRRIEKMNDAEFAKVNEGVREFLTSETPPHGGESPVPIGNNK